MSTFKSAKTLDIPMARKVLEHLRAHPDEHSQVDFGRQTPCGTKHCIAGTAVMLDSTTAISWLSGGLMKAWVSVGGKEVELDDRAAELLGLSDDRDIERLFYDFNDGRALDKLENWIAQAEKVQR